MPQRLRYQLALPPSDVITRIERETVPFHSVANFRSPVDGYVKFIGESFTGPRQFVSKIQGDSFAIMTIGMWPFKGSPTGANVGSMKGTVKPSGEGSIVEARFRLFPVMVIGVVAMTLMFAFFAALSLILAVTMDAEMDLAGRVFALAVSGAFLCFGLLSAAYLALCGYLQKKATSRFLDRLFADASE